MIVIGLMSGTSCDAIEGAAADFVLQGENLVMRPLGALTHEYSDDVRNELLAALPPAPTNAAIVCRLDTLIGRALAATAARVIDEVCKTQAELISSHGHTLYHWTEGGRVEGTSQIGQPAWIAERTGLPVVSDLRARDVTRRGQGAPLISTFDVLAAAGIEAAEARSKQRPRPSAALNLGGIANITVLGADVTVAYDTGPGNALIDAAAELFSDGRELMDRDGQRAARGRVDEALLADLLAHPYYEAAPPKSTGKEVFNLDYLRAHLNGRALNPDDVLATVTMLTARTVARELARYGVATVVASGGGTRNPSLMRALADAVGGIEIKTTEFWGIPPLAKEAYGFALLGWLSYHGLPGNIPACTGAEGPAILGTITPGRTPLRLPAPPPAAPKRLTIVRN